MTKLAIDREDTIDCLDEAICSLMTLRVAIAGVPTHELPDSIDEALRGDPDFQQAKLDAQRAWEPIIEEVGCSRACLDAEAATTHMAAEACRVGFQLAMVIVARQLEERREEPGRAGSGR